MSHYEIVHTDTVQGFEIELAFTPETDKPDWDFENEQDEQDTLEKIDNGFLLWFVARVTASKAGVNLGTDYLGGCCYSSAQEFIEGGYYADMVQQAITEAEQTITKLIEA